MADGWYIAVLVETDEVLKPRADASGVVGIDMGPKPHRALDARLRRLNRSLARKDKGSANWKKAKTSLSRLHKRMVDIREDATHKLSHRLVTGSSVVGLEDLNVKGMAANHHLARSVADSAMRSLRIKIEYKAAMTGATIVVVDRWYPSSETCSCCGQHHPEIVLGVDTLRYATLRLRRRDRSRPECGEQHRQLRGQLSRVSLWSGRRWRRFGGVKPAALKQEERNDPISQIGSDISERSSTL